jgi:predicted regulator of Ras-like GTPase activity (Roadblock/LC7/MglB family)
MGFSEQLQQIVASVDGAIACSVMGFDGIAVETVQSKKAEGAAAALELNSAWVEYANVLSQVKATAETLKTGKVSELSVNTEKVITLMRMVTPDYFLVLGLLPSGNYGKGRYVLRISAPKLAADLT